MYSRATIVCAPRMVRPYIAMSKCIVHSDHKRLSYDLKRVSAHPSLAKRVLELQNYNVTIEIIKSKQNRVADALSRVDENSPARSSDVLDDIIEFN